MKSYPPPPPPPPPPPRQQQQHAPRYQYRPLDYSKRGAVVDWLQTALGVAIFFAAFYVWDRLAAFLPNANWRAWTLFGLFAALLLAIDALARAEWGWNRLRVGFVLALFAVAGFWGVRLWIWGMAHWRVGG